MDKKRYTSLEEIFSDDSLGLLNVKPAAQVISEDERLINSFQEIIEFYEVNNREPHKKNGFKERMLHSRLEGLRTNESHIKKLSSFDIYSFLPSLDLEDETTVENTIEEKPTVEITSVQDILDLDPFGLLGGGSAEQLGIFELNHVTAHKDREKTDEVAKRKRCKDFDQYEPLFKKVHEELKSGERKYIDFTIGTLKENTFYLHKGMIFFIESIDWSRENSFKEDGTRVRKDGRTRCIFENGTESNMLYRSVEKMMYNDAGKAITHPISGTEDYLFNQANLVQEDDVATGYIYILQSKSPNQFIQAIPNLHKIGFSTTPVRTRINNAKNEPTYLMDEVHLLSEIKTYNLNPQKFESIIHRVFGEVCVDLEVADKYGIKHKPKEWFSVPYSVIDEVIDRILDESILGFSYDPKKMYLVKR
ncbi:GIY-YIG nuclease family protein [Empedobacter tilapiae]|uniref:GIY-YIG nuclease family protein n=1 Tax=Empedobacter tilapiae TaxID=2491114 RepID=A0A4Z1C0H1_9FLAO|nr:GIY-YIG nuclease family protein [Empedobacter tilapiae]TGN29182.1 GIY-YIG nuclease family protein [Empedobacter tilapiae]